MKSVALYGESGTHNGLTIIFVKHTLYTCLDHFFKKIKRVLCINTGTKEVPAYLQKIYKTIKESRRFPNFFKE